MNPIPPFVQLSDADYAARTQAVFAAVERTIDRLLDDDVIDIDANRVGGLLEMTFPNRSKIIINTQPPLHELWLAAPSGGHHFKAGASGQWLDTRDGSEFFALLSACASAQGEVALRFEP